MNDILKSFTCAIMAPNNRLPDELIGRILASHSGKGCCLAEQDMTQLIGHFVMTMTTFAKTRPFFQSLSNQEQIKAPLHLGIDHDLLDFHLDYLNFFVLIKAHIHMYNYHIRDFPLD